MSNANAPRRPVIPLVTSALGIGGIALLVPLGHARPTSTDVHLSVWVVIALFAIAESCVVHVYVDRQARTFSLSEIPLLLGLAYLSPVALVVGRLVGSAIALALVRRQTATKLAFNLSYFLLDTGLAIVVYRAVIGSASPFEARGWVAALAATTASLIVGSVVVSLVIAASEGKRMRSPLESLIGLGTITTALSTYLGVMAVTALAPVRMSPWLFAAAAAMIFAAYRSHSRVRRGADHLEQLYEFSSAIASSLSLGAVDFALLEHTSELLRADRAELILSNQDTAAFITLHNGALSVLNGALAETALDGHRALLDGRDLALVGDAMVATLRAGDEPMGTLLVSGRLGQTDRFNAQDLQLFETVATHGAICLRNYRLLERLRREADERQRQALHDSLTGLPNRARLDDVLHRALTNRQEDELVVVMVIDLDRFKEVNDTLGHHQGDILLCKIAERITEAVEDETLVARLGGDEFAVVLTTTAGREAIKAHAEAIEHRLLEPFELDGLVFEVGSSIGIALAPADGDDPSALLQRADVAMYAAKRGSTSAEFYNVDIDHASPRQLALAAELRRDIGRRELLVEYQPKAALPSGDVVGVEALARWHHPQHGFIAPEVFIAIAERSGLIRPLTECVLDIAVGQVAQWRAEGFELDMAVNISTRNLLDESLPPMVAAALSRHGVPASALTLEITESTIIADPARTVGTLNRLSDMGIALAIDDFGTGYSSLSYLHRLPVDEIKIDKSFVQRMTSDDSDSVIVHSTIDLGHNLGLQVTAEGVEDGQTWQLLAAAGCDQAQGFYLRASGTGAQLTRWLRSRRDEQAALRGLIGGTTEATEATQPSTSTTSTL
jgi:diguanylate cyclase (GGDEF)-like protein